MAAGCRNSSTRRSAQAIETCSASDYDLLLGRRTYDIFAAYWPYVGGEATGIGEIFDKTGKDDGEAAAIEMGEAFTRANKYVLTRGTPDLGWPNSHRVGEPRRAARGQAKATGPTCSSRAAARSIRHCSPRG